MAGMDNTFYAASLDEWRSWLETNHASRNIVWLVFYKAHSGRPCISRGDATDEALCWGWIDSIIKRIDEDTYMLKFTPRTDVKKWSAVNIRRVRDLVANGRMRDAGLAKFPVELLRDDTSGLATQPADALGRGTDLTASTVGTHATVAPEIPEHLMQVLAENPVAFANFAAMAPSYRRTYARWIMSARRPETQVKRMREAAGLLEKKIKNPMK